jgi:hypothetical protein
VPVTRSYRCTDCGAQFTHFHHGRDEPYPACPVCPPVEAPKPTEWVPQGFSITTNKSRAIDYTQSMAETQFGLTNIRDNLRAGDIAAPPAPGPSSHEQATMKEMMRQAHEAANAPAEIPLQSFWNQASGAPLSGQSDPTAPVPGAAEARASGLDAVSLVEKAKASGSGGMKLQVVARGNEG